MEKATAIYLTLGYVFNWVCFETGLPKTRRAHLCPRGSDAPNNNVYEKKLNLIGAKVGRKIDIQARLPYLMFIQQCIKLVTMPFSCPSVPALSQMSALLLLVLRHAYTQNDVNNHPAERSAGGEEQVNEPHYGRVPAEIACYAPADPCEPLVACRTCKPLAHADVPPFSV